jgi:hypothetical protein
MTGPPARFKVRLVHNRVKCAHREGAVRCEAWAVWRVPPRASLWGNQGTRYYCNAHVPDLPEAPREKE